MVDSINMDSRMKPQLRKLSKPSATDVSQAKKAKAKQSEQIKQVGQIQQAEKAETQGLSGEGVGVHVSHSLAHLVSLLSSPSGDESERIAAVKQQVTDHTYSIDMDKLATRLTNSGLFNEA